jgi:hypothetical protein
MPLKKEEDFGTNEDNSKNKEYCQFCFKGGKFSDEGISMEQKIDNLVEIGKSKLGMTEEQARDMANGIIPNLKRWKK